jgi:FkbM family methyltransferase
LPAERRRRGNIKLDLFEPVPKTVEHLCRFMSTAELCNKVQIHDCAVSDHSGTASMALMSDTGGTNSLHFAQAGAAPPAGWLTVRTVTLSDFVRQNGIEHIHLVKSDAEGHDLAVLRGARELLSDRRIDVFQFEYNHSWILSRSFLRDVFELIGGLSYRVARIMPAHLEVFTDWHPELERFFHANYVLLGVRALEWFKVRYGYFDKSNTLSFGKAG